MGLVVRVYQRVHLLKFTSSLFLKVMNLTEFRVVLFFSKVPFGFYCGGEFSLMFLLLV